MDRIVIDLDDSFWPSDPGYNIGGMLRAPYCALGKLGYLTNTHGIDVYGLYQKLANVETSKEIYALNDGLNGAGDRQVDNHWAAVRLMLQRLQESGNVKFKGTKVSDILKEQRSAEVVNV